MAFTPPKVTLVAPVKLFPVMVTEVPTAPLVGLKLRITGVTRNFWLLVLLPLVPAVFTKPVVAPAGTLVEMYVSETIVNAAFVPLNWTVLVPVKP